MRNGAAEASAVSASCRTAQLPVTVLHSRRKTIALEICPDGEILVRAPFRMSEAELRRFLSEKQQWLDTHLKRVLEQKRQRDALPKQPRLTRTELSVLADQAMQYFPARCAAFSPLVGVSYGRITIRNQKSRWGSCSGRGNLNFNCLLMLAPAEIRDYVIVHELCHRIEMNHSPRFWAEVQRVLPDYRARRLWLRENGGSIMRRMTG